MFTDQFMTKNLNRIFPSARLRLVLWSLFLVGAVVAASYAIGSSHGTAEGVPGSASSQNVGTGVSDIPGPVVVSSPPQCGGCLQPMEFRENLDDVMPPALPFGW